VERVERRSSAELCLVFGLVFGEKIVASSNDDDPPSRSRRAICAPGMRLSNAEYTRVAVLGRGTTPVWQDSLRSGPAPLVADEAIEDAG
jgi:hypothetical protein